MGLRRCPGMDESIIGASLSHGGSETAAGHVLLRELTLVGGVGASHIDVWAGLNCADKQSEVVLLCCCKAIYQVCV